MNYLETEYGFEWGSAKIVRACKDSKRGWIIMLLETPKYKDNKAIQIYITKTGKVRVFSPKEWKPPKT